MSIRFTIQQIKDLKAQGKIKDYKIVAPPKAPDQPAGRRVGKHFKKAHPAKDQMAREMLEWCQLHGFVLFEEYNFNPLRRWRFDWAIDPDGKRLAIEYEGLSAKKTGHTTSKGFTGNTEKYNSAAALGWKVLRFTYLNYEDLITELNKHV
jgi:hypothetical protein